MSIKFKFRSCVDYDAIKIHPQPSIAVRDLKAEIARRKNLYKGRCDLHLFDPITGKEYKDGDFKIPSGATVIVKRVPAGMVSSSLMKHVKLDDKLKKQDPKLDKFPGSMSLPTEEDFDDFGDDIYLNFKTSMADPCVRNDQLNCVGDAKPFNASIRIETQKPDARDVRGNLSRGVSYSVAGEDMKNRKMGNFFHGSEVPALRSVDMTTAQMEFKMPVYPPITERGSNQIIGETGHELQIRNKRRQIPYNDEVGDRRLMGGSRHHKSQDLACPNSLPFRDSDYDPRDQGHHSCFTSGFPGDFTTSCPVDPDLATMPLAENPMFPWAMPGYYAYDNFGSYYDNSGMMYFNYAMPPTLQHVVSPSMPSMPNGQPVSRVRTGSGAVGVTSNMGNTDHRRRRSSAADVKVLSQPRRHEERSKAEADDGSLNFCEQRERRHRICHRTSRDNEEKDQRTSDSGQRLGVRKAERS